MAAHGAAPQSTIKKRNFAVVRGGKRSPHQWIGLAISSSPSEIWVLTQVLWSMPQGLPSTTCYELLPQGVNGLREAQDHLNTTSPGQGFLAEVYTALVGAFSVESAI